MRAISKRLSEVLGAHCANPTSRQIDEPLQEGCVINWLAPDGTSDSETLEKSKKIISIDLSF